MSWGGFSLHAGVAARADQRHKLEQWCRYISRSAISEKRLPLTPNGNVGYQLKTLFPDRTTHVIFEPLDFIARPAALVPKPRVNLTGFHGVFAPNSRYCSEFTPYLSAHGGFQHYPAFHRPALECLEVAGTQTAAVQQPLSLDATSGIGGDPASQREALDWQVSRDCVEKLVAKNGWLVFRRIV